MNVKHALSKINPVRHFRIAGMVYKEFKLLIRMKKAPILILSLPILLMIIYGTGSSALSNPQTVINAGACNNDPGATSMIQSITGNFNIQILNPDNCVTELVRRVKNGDFIIGFVIPAGFSQTLKDGRQAVINYYVDDSKPLTASLSGYFLEQGFNQYSTGVIQGAQEELKSMSSDARTKLDSIIIVINSTSKVLEDNKALFTIAYPLMNSYISNALTELATYDKDLAFVQNISVQFLTKPLLFNKEPTYPGVNASSFNFASIYAIISLFTLLLLASSGIIYDKKTDYLLRLKATKTFIPTYLLSKLILYTVISIAQLLIVMLLTTLQGAVFKLEFTSLITAVITVTAFNASIGLLIGKLSDNENVAILSSLMLSLPFLFLSGVFFPLEYMPDYVKVIAEIVPLYKEINLLKQAVVLGTGLATIQGLLTDMGILSLIILVIDYALIKYKD